MGIGRTNAVSAGGASLNFSVVGGTSTPANPKENMIWVNTSTAITNWHFCADEPNAYKLKTRSESNIHSIVSPKKLSAGDILNFEIPATVIGTREAIDVYDPFAQKHYYVRQGNGTAVGSWPIGMKVGVCIEDTVITINGYGGDGTARLKTWNKYYHVEGTLWLQTAASSQVPFNALKKNEITVYPLSAKQYISGAWTEKTAKSYQGGAWADWWNGELYEPGNQYESITGGWVCEADVTGFTAATMTETSNGLHITADSSKAYMARVRTANKVDLKGKSKLTAKVSVASGFGVSKIFATDIYASKTGEFTAEATIAGTEATLDVSGLNGEYYVGVLFYNTAANPKNSDVTVTEVRIS